LRQSLNLKLKLQSNIRPKYDTLVVARSALTQELYMCASTPVRGPIDYSVQFTDVTQVR